MKLWSVILILACNTVPGSAQWATDQGSAYSKGAMSLFGGGTVGYLGFFGGFEYGFHEAISGSVATGFNVWWPFNNWRYYHVPISVRAAFHPFNLSVLSDKIPVRDRLDPYVGLSSGWQIGWHSWEGPGRASTDPDVGGYFFREYIGVKWYPTPRFFLTLEEGAGIAWLAIGAGIRLN